MAVILTERFGENWQLFCEECLTPLNVVSSVELVGMQAGFMPVLCFGCDGGADEIPEILYSNESPYLLIIGGTNIVINPWKELQNSTRRLNRWKEVFARVLGTVKRKGEEK